MKKPSILIADDDPELRGALAEQLALHEEFLPTQAQNATEALAITHEYCIAFHISRTLPPQRYPINAAIASSETSPATCSNGRLAARDNK